MGLGPRIIAGTDAGCFDFSFGHMDYCFDLMVAAGLTPMQALKIRHERGSRRVRRRESGRHDPGRQARRHCHTWRQPAR
jgi:adenine deaminase